MGAKNNGQSLSSIDTSMMLKGKSSSSSKPHYQIFVENDIVVEAVKTNWEQYVTQEGHSHLLEHLGYIDPRLVIQLSSNLGRKLEKAEIELLGGFDGDQETLCELTAAQLIKESEVTSFDDLTSAQKNECMFRPHWGLAFTGGNVIVHLLNVMLAPDKPHQNDLAQALLFVNIDQMILRGNKLKVCAGEKVATVSGKFFHIAKDGAIYRQDLIGLLGQTEKQLCLMGVKERCVQTDGDYYELTPFEVTIESLLGRLRKHQEAIKEEIRGRKVGITRTFAASLLGKKPETVAATSPVRNS